MSDEITKLLEQWRAGDIEAGKRVVAETYGELRRAARGHLRGERPGHTLQATALLHEAFVRLLSKGPGTADNREAFFRLMAAEMRHRLIDHARRRLTVKRGAGVIHLPLESSTIAVVGPDEAEDIDAILGRLDRALKELSVSSPRTAQVVHLRFIAGLTTEQTAARLGLSSGTIKREWTFARAWLAAAMEPDTSTQTR